MVPGGTFAPVTEVVETIHSVFRAVVRTLKKPFPKLMVSCDCSYLLLQQPDRYSPCRPSQGRCGSQFSEVFLSEQPDKTSRNSKHLLTFTEDA